MCWDLNRPFDVGSRKSKNFDTFQQLVMLCKRAGGGADAAGAERHTGMADGSQGLLSRMSGIMGCFASLKACYPGCIICLLMLCEHAGGGENAARG